MHNHPSQLT